MMRKSGVDIMKIRYELNMTQGSIFKSIILFTFPMMLSSILQLFFNTADLIVVSRWSGSNAMASVGSTSALTNMIVNLFIGMSIGATVAVSRNYGAGNREGMDRAIHTSMFFSIIVGLSAFVIGQMLCKPLLILMDTPSGKVLDGAVLYMRIIFLGTPATVAYNYGASILRAIGDTKRPLYILAISGTVNFVLNLIFVIFFNMGVAGVALATAISKYISAILVLTALKEKNSNCRLEFKKLKIYKKELSLILKIGVPAGIQNIFVGFANTIIQSAVNGFGTAAIAGNAAAANIESYAVAVKAAFRQATVTAVGQNYGAKNEKRISQSVRTAMICMIVGCLLLGGLMTIFSKQLLGIYITDSDDAIRFGTMRIILTAIPYFFSGIHEITAGYLRGIGYSTLTTVNAFIGMVIFRISYVLFVFPIFNTFEVLYLGTPTTWILISILNAISLLFVKKKAMIKMYQN